MKKEEGTTISIWVDLDTAARVTRLAKKLGMSRSRLLKNVALSGLEDAELLEKMGILTLSLMIQKTKERIDTLVEEGKRQFVEA